VAITSYLERRWYLTSEGTSTHDTRRASGLIMVVSGQAADGQDLAQYFALRRHRRRPADRRRADRRGQAAERRSARADPAPSSSAYTGPVLFEGPAAADVVRWSLAPHLDGTPVPRACRRQEAKRFGGELADKVGARVLAPMLSVVDDPTAARSGATSVIGGYKVDDEGVPPQRSR
jgi:predicted Zn-dependent protease